MIVSDHMRTSGLAGCSHMACTPKDADHIKIFWNYCQLEAVVPQGLY